MKPQITKIERTDANVDNSVYEIPVEHTDDYGNLYYTKLVRPCVEYDAEIQAKKDALQEEIDALKDKEEVAKRIAEKEAELESLSVVEIVDNIVK